MSERGSLRTYLGTAPGVGKTFTMLADGRERAARGERVVIGWVESKGRAATRRQRGDLEMIPPREVAYRGLAFQEPDVGAVIASGADVVLIDELAHRWPDGSRERIADVEQMLDAGMDVMTTLNISNLESVREYAATLTGVGATERVPDDLVRAGEVVLVDLPPDALRRRIASGAVFSTNDVGGALARYFRASNLEALSELGRAWMADEVDRVGSELLGSRGLLESEDPSIVIAGDSGSDWGERVIRRAAELARADDAELLVVHVEPTRPARPDQRVRRHRELAEELGGRYLEVVADSAADELARIAEQRGATTVVVGRHRSRLGELLHGSIAARLGRRLRAGIVEAVVNEPAGPATADTAELDADADAWPGTG